MKKIALIMAIIMLMGALVACSKTPGVDDSMKKVEYDPELRIGTADFLLFIPENYETKLYTSTVCASCDKLSVSVIGSDVSGVVTSLDKWNEKEANLKAVFGDYELISLDKEAKVANLPATKVLYTATVAGVPLSFEQYYFLRAASLYVLTFSYSKEDESTVKDDISTITDAFSFDKEAKAPDGMKAAAMMGEKLSAPAGCTMYIDKNWDVSFAAGAVTCRLANSYKANISLMCAPCENMSIEEYFESDLDNMRDSLNDFTLLEDECKADLLDSHAARKYVFTTNGPASEDVQVHYKICQYLCKKGDAMYILTYTADYQAQDQAGSDYYEQFYEDFENVIKYFKFDD